MTKNISITLSSPSTAKILLAVGITVFFWASSLVAIHIAMESYEPGTLAFFRYLIASIGMLFIYKRIANGHRIPWKDIPIIMICGIFGFAIYNIALNYGQLTISAGVSGFIMSQIPVMVVLLAIMFLGEKLSIQAWMGIGISFTGISIIAISQQQQTAGINWGILYLLTAVVSAGIYLVLAKHLLKRHHNRAMELTAYAMWGGTLAMGFYAPSLWEQIPLATATATWAAIYLGLFPGLIGYLSWNFALDHAPASRVSSALYTMPLITAILGWLCLGQIPTGLALIGGGIALGGAILVAVSSNPSAAAPIASPPKQ